MSDLQQRIEALYRSDLRGSALLIICLCGDDPLRPADDLATHTRSRIKLVWAIAAAPC